MSVRFEDAQELSAYFEQLKETIHDEERRMILRGEAIAENLYAFSAYRKLQARLKVAARQNS